MNKIINLGLLFVVVVFFSSCAFFKKSIDTLPEKKELLDLSSDSTSFVMSKKSTNLAFEIKGLDDETLANGGTRLTAVVNPENLSFVDGVYDERIKYQVSDGEEELEIKLSLEKGIIKSFEMHLYKNGELNYDYSDGVVSGLVNDLVGKSIEDVRSLDSSTDETSLLVVALNEAIDNVFAKAVKFN